MPKTAYVIDTNVLLHDPDAINKFQDSEIVIPLPVLEELDTLKRNTDERGRNARNFIRFIDSLKGKGDFSKGIPLEGGRILRIYADVKGTEKKQFPLPLDRNNMKLFMAFQIHETNPHVVFLSKDLVMRVKAEAIGLASEDYESLNFSYEKLYKGYRRLEVSKDKIDQFFKEGFLPIEGKARPNEYFLLTSPEKSSAVAKYHPDRKRLEPLIKVSQDIWGILPLNLEQKCALDLLLRDEIKLVTLVGPAGTGKTLLTLACAMRKVFDEGLYSRILVSRPIVPLGKDIGYLPGTKEEKLYHWMQPINDNLEFLCASTSGEQGNGDETQAWVLESNKIEMEAVTYIRGRSLPKMFIIVDEAQNLTPHEVKTIISRAGQGTKVVLTGDPTQIDNPYLDKDSNALTFTVGKFADQRLYGHMFLERTERSELAAVAAEIL